MYVVISTRPFCKNKVKIQKRATYGITEKKFDYTIRKSGSAKEERPFLAKGHFFSITLHYVMAPLKELLTNGHQLGSSSVVNTLKSKFNFQMGGTK